MTTFAENVASHCLIRVGHNSEGKLLYKFSPQRAWLKRASGAPFAEARHMYWLLGLLGQSDSAGGVDETQFLIATLLAFDKKALQHYGDHRHLPSGPPNFGASLDELEGVLYPSEHEAKRDILPDSKRRVSPIERRLLLLLDTQMEPDGTGDLPFRLGQIVKFALAKETQLDWNALMRDLHQWNRPDKKRQKEWARAFYGYRRPPEAPANPMENAATDDSDIDLEED